MQLPIFGNVNDVIDLFGFLILRKYCSGDLDF